MATKTARPPGPKLSSLGALRRFRDDPIGLLQEAARYGDVAYLQLPRFPAYLLNHPDYVQDVLVSGSHDVMKGPTIQGSKLLLGESVLTTEGDVHKRQRRVIGPIFHRERINGYGAVIVERALRTSDGWRDGQALDVHREMAMLTLSVVAETLFGTDIDAVEASAVGEALSTMLAMFDLVYSPFLPILRRLPLPRTRRFEEARRRLDAIVFRMIEERRARGATGEDLLSLLLRAEDAEAGDSPLSDQEVRDQAMTLFLAGHETTSNALTWTWFLLSQHADAEATLHAELDEALGDHPPVVADIPRLPYTEMVLAESMRMYPPAWAIGRRALANLEIGGLTIPAGSVLVLSQYLVHHDPRWWPDPWAFRPERFTPQARAARPRSAYFPFGAGPRMCVGEPFARMEAVLLIAALAQRWRFQHDPSHLVELQPVITLRPRFGMTMTLERRTSPSANPRR